MSVTAGSLGAAFVLAVSLTALGGRAVGAQLPLPPKPASSGDRRGLEIPKPVVAPSPKPGADRPETSGGAEQAPMPADPFAANPALPGLDRAGQILRALSTVKDERDPLASRAQEELLREGELGLASLHAALQSGNGPTVAVAARVLKTLERPESLGPVVAALRATPPSEAIRPLLDAAIELDPQRSIDLLFELSDHPAATVRGHSSGVLVGLLRAMPSTAALEPRVSSLARSKRSETRQMAAQLYSSLSDESAVRGLTALLDDSSPAVASAAALALANQLHADTAAILRDSALRVPIGRGFGYHCIALTLRDERRGEPVDGEVAQRALSALRSPEPFVAAACAALLADVGYRSPDPSSTTYLEQEVVPILVNAAAGATFFRDFNSIHTLALRKLALLSDRDFGNDGPAWARWWRDRAPTFRANRAGFTLEPADLDSLAIDIDRPRGRYTLRGPSAPPGNAAADEEDFVLEEAELKALHSSLVASRLLEPSTLPGVRGTTGRDSAEPAVNVRLRANAQRKDVGLAERASWPELEALVSACDAVRASNLWQRYRDPLANVDREEFFRVERAFRARESSQEARDGRLMAQIVSALPSLPRQRQPAALKDLLAIPALDQRINESQAVRIASLLATVGPDAEAELDVVRVASSVKTPAVHEALMVRAAAMSRGRAREVLRQILDAFGHSFALQSLDDPRAVVRAACTEYLGRTGGPSIVAALLERLGDASEEVQSAAAAALGARRDPAALGPLLRLEPLASDTLRASILVALGRIGGEEVLPVLLAALDAHRSSVRKSGLEGLAELRDPRSTERIARHWQNALRDGPISVDEAAAARAALTTIGGTAARDALRRILDPESRASQREVAILLAELGDAAAVPALLGELERGVDSSVRTALTTLTCVDLFESTDPVRAYTDWWATRRSLSSTTWFVDACATSGVGVGLSPTLLDSPQAANAVPSLCDVVALADPWYLRVRAAQVLRSVTGQSFGEVARFTPAADRSRIVAQYRTLYDANR